MPQVWRHSYLSIMNKAFCVLLMMLFAGSLISSPLVPDYPVIASPADSVSLPGITQFRIRSAAEAEKMLIHRFPEMTEAKRKKIIAAMLAFPFPFGFMGAHRVLLGCKPWVPVVYVATFGGCFGLLPMLDFIAIVCSKDIEQYENNPNVFMWLK
jgi:TM2 domain-containing membrane protein YozV